MSTGNKNDIKVNIGAPPQDTRKKKLQKYVLYFGAIGIILAIILITFYENFDRFGAQFGQKAYWVVSLSISGGGLSAIVGMLQVVILKDRIASRHWLFVIASAIGGTIAGSIAGGLRYYGAVTSGFWIGAIIGLVGGLLSGLIQNSLMTKYRTNSRWVIFSAISWSGIFAIGWAISWAMNSEYGSGFGALLIILGSGVALSMFLGSIEVDIEFS